VFGSCHNTSSSSSNAPSGSSWTDAVRQAAEPERDCKPAASVAPVSQPQTSVLADAAAAELLAGLTAVHARRAGAVVPMPPPLPVARPLHAQLGGSSMLKPAGATLDGAVAAGGAPGGGSKTWRDWLLPKRLLHWSEGEAAPGDDPALQQSCGNDDVAAVRADQGAAQQGRSGRGSRRRPREDDDEDGYADDDDDDGDGHRGSGASAAAAAAALYDGSVSCQVMVRPRSAAASQQGPHGALPGAAGSRVPGSVPEVAAPAGEAAGAAAASPPCSPRTPSAHAMARDPAVPPAAVAAAASARHAAGTGAPAAAAGGARSAGSAAPGADAHAVLVDEVLAGVAALYGSDAYVADCALTCLLTFVRRKLLPDAQLPRLHSEDAAAAIVAASARSCALPLPPRVAAAAAAAGLSPGHYKLLAEFVQSPQVAFLLPASLKAALHCLGTADLHMALAYVGKHSATSSALPTPAGKAAAPAGRRRRSSSGGSSTSSSAAVSSSSSQASLSDATTDADSDGDFSVTGTEDGDDDDDDEDAGDEDELGCMSLFQLSHFDEAALDRLAALTWPGQLPTPIPPPSPPAAPAAAPGGAGDKRKHGRGSAAAAGQAGAADTQQQQQQQRPQPQLLVVPWWLEHLRQVSRASEPSADVAADLRVLRWVYGNIESSQADEMAARQAALRGSMDRTAALLELYDGVAHAWRRMQRVADRQQRLEHLRARVKVSCRGRRGPGVWRLVGAKLKSLLARVAQRLTTQRCMHLLHAPAAGQVCRCQGRGGCLRAVGRPRAGDHLLEHPQGQPGAHASSPAAGPGAARRWLHAAAAAGTGCSRAPRRLCVAASAAIQAAAAAAPIPWQRAAPAQATARATAATRGGRGQRFTAAAGGTAAAATSAARRRLAAARVQAGAAGAAVPQAAPQRQRQRLASRCVCGGRRSRCGGAASASSSASCAAHVAAHAAVHLHDAPVASAPVRRGGERSARGARAGERGGGAVCVRAA
jgi:hypothetical protein